MAVFFFSLFLLVLFLLVKTAPGHQPVQLGVDEGQEPGHHLPAPCLRGPEDFGHPRTYPRKSQNLLRRARLCPLLRFN
jgi:hypothetical protein